MTVYLTKAFVRFARKAVLGEAALIEAARAVEEGRCDADLGGGVYKQRVARAGGGKSGGFRAIILFRSGADSFFVHGYAKSEKAALTEMELRVYRRLAKEYLGAAAEYLAALIAAGELIEVSNHGFKKD